MIKSFADKRTAALFFDQPVKRVARDLQIRARNRLVMLDQAVRHEDLRMPPGNRLEALQGDRQGQYSIRVNDQWRICFVWRDDDVFDVELVDYHQG